MSKKTTTKKTNKNTTKKKSVDKSRTAIIASSNLLPSPVPKETIKKLIESVRGRPVLYEDWMPNQAIMLMAEGRSKEDASILMGISPTSFFRWIDKAEGNEDFKPELWDAIKIGEFLSRFWWSEIGRQNINNKDKFNHTLWMMNMQNRHGWTRRIDGNIDIKTENITTEKKVVEFRMDQQSHEYIAELLKILVDSGAIESGIIGQPSSAEAN